MMMMMMIDVAGNVAKGGIINRLPPHNSPFLSKSRCHCSSAHAISVRLCFRGERNSIQSCYAEKGQYHIFNIYNRRRGRRRRNRKERKTIN